MFYFVRALEFSKRYRIALMTCSSEIDNFIEIDSCSESQKEEDIEKIKYLKSTSQIFSFYELIWHLCEIMFMKSEIHGQITQNLMSWISSQSSNVLKRAKEILQVSASEAVDIESLWDSILSLLIYNDITNVIALLELHPKSNYPEFRILRRLLGNIPDFADENGKINPKFEKEWNFWQNECKSQLSTTKIEHKSDSDEDIDECYFRIISSILSGSDYIWHHPLVIETLGNASDWYIRFIGKLFYCHRFISSKNIAYELSEWNRMSEEHGCGDGLDSESIGQEENLSLTKRIIESVLCKDLTGFLNFCSGKFNCWWISVHFLHLLVSQKAWILRQTGKKGRFDMLDLMVIGFVDSILSTSDYTLTPIAIGYLETINKRKRNDKMLTNQIKSRQAIILDKVRYTSNRRANYVNLLRRKLKLPQEIDLVIKNDLIKIPNLENDQENNVEEHSELLRRILLVVNKLLSLPENSSLGLLDKLIQRALHVTANLLLIILAHDDENQQADRFESLTEVYEITSTSLLNYFNSHSNELTPSAAFFVAQSKLIADINGRDDECAIKDLIQLLSYQAIVIPGRLKTTLLALMTHLLTKVDENNSYTVAISFDQIQAIFSIIPLDCSRELNYALTKRLSELKISIK